MNAQLDMGTVVPSVSIEGLLMQRDSVVNQLRQAIGILVDAQRFTEENNMFTGSEYRKLPWVIDGENSRFDNKLLSHEGFPEMLKRLDSALWHKLMYESGMLSFMDSKARSEFRSKIDTCETPALTLENIIETFKQLHAGRGDMFERGVIRCFKSLSWCYKTNNPFRFGKRIIVSYLRSSYGGWNSGKTAELDDLQRVFRILDGKPEEDYRNGLSARLSAVGRGCAIGSGHHKDDYVEVKWFKNGNGHLLFTRPDLVEKMNSIIAKHYPGALAAPQS